MAFTVKIQRNDSEVIKVDKEISDLAEVQGSLKEGTSIIEPHFLLQVELATMANANYLTVAAFGRKYYVGEIVSATNQLVEVSCHVDVLESFKSYIRENKGIIHRQENNWNLYLNDGVLKTYQNPIVTTHFFPQGFSGQSYALVLSGTHGGGTYVSGGSDTEGKTTQGLAQYAQAQLGLPYWYGTYGQIATQDLLNWGRTQYASYYTATNFSSQFGLRVHDCVGLIKGYRWSATPTSTPVYDGAQDVDVDGLYSQCNIVGTIGDVAWTSIYSAMPGVCVFVPASSWGYSHVGVSMGDGTVIEARSHADGVVQRSLSVTGFRAYGIPNWLFKPYNVDEG